MLPALPQVGSALSAEQVATIEAQVTSAVMAVTSIDALKEWLAQMSALEAYLRSRDMQGPALGASRRVEGRIGQLFGEPQPGGRGKKNPYRRKKTHHRADEFHDQLILEFRLLGRALAGEAKLTADEWRKSRAALVALVRLRLGLQPITPPFPNETFHCIVVDPPWELTTGPNVFGSKERGNEALAYSQMTLDDIRDLDVKQLAAPDAHLYLWTTNKYLEDAYDIARAWGFELYTIHDWEHAGARHSREDMPNRLEDWLTVDIAVLAHYVTAHRLEPRSFQTYVAGRQAERPGYLWPVSLWMPLASWWDPDTTFF